MCGWYFARLLHCRHLFVGLARFSRTENYAAEKLVRQNGNHVCDSHMCRQSGWAFHQKFSAQSRIYTFSPFCILSVTKAIRESLGVSFLENAGNALPERFSTDLLGIKAFLQFTKTLRIIYIMCVLLFCLQTWTSGVRRSKKSSPNGSLFTPVIPI